jgi:hypothetical protein
MNTPYVKQFNELGECINLITIENPYLSLSIIGYEKNKLGEFKLDKKGDKIPICTQNRRTRRFTSKPFNNRKITEGRKYKNEILN